MINTDQELIQSQGEPMAAKTKKIIIKWPIIIWLFKTCLNIISVHLTAVYLVWTQPGLQKGLLYINLFAIKSVSTITSEPNWQVSTSRHLLIAESGEHSDRIWKIIIKKEKKNQMIILLPESEGYINCHRRSTLCHNNYPDRQDGLS